MDARNPGSSANVTVAHSWIDNGDDNIAIKTGTTHMSVLDNHFYSGHGMSIGSEPYRRQLSAGGRFDRRPLRGDHDSQGSCRCSSPSRATAGEKFRIPSCGPVQTS
jgi:hypothetical protein